MIIFHMDVETIIHHLGLQPHPEGGFYRETYRSRETIAAAALPSRYGNDRNFSTAIYYLLTPDSHSTLHKVRSDEVFHFYAGDPVTMLQLHGDGRGETIVLGSDIAAGQQLQVVVPEGVWQGLFLNDGGAFALLGATVSPGFDFADFEVGTREALIRQYPACRALIERLTAN
jgi:predicted cupin superfamily sugar epimerase